MRLICQGDERSVARGRAARRAGCRHVNSVNSVLVGVKRRADDLSNDRETGDDVDDDKTKDEEDEEKNDDDDDEKKRNARPSVPCRRCGERPGPLGVRRGCSRVP